MENAAGRLTKIKLTTPNVQQIINQAGLGQATQTVRLLSCSDLESAVDLSKALPNKPIQATDGIVRIHPDGGITTVPREPGGSTQWYRIENGQKTPIASPQPPASQYANQFMEMGATVANFANDLKNKGFNRLRNKFVGYTPAEHQRFLDNFEYAPDDVLRVLNDGNKTLLTRWEAGTIQAAPPGFKRYYYDRNGSTLQHADIGDFNKPSDPNISLESGTMTGGGHGQTNIDYLNALGRPPQIQHTFSNGVRTGSVANHRDALKKAGHQAWFPASWTAQDIDDAAKAVMAQKPAQWAAAPDGVPVDGVYKGVKVVIMKEKGVHATTFPDKNVQPSSSGGVETTPTL